MAIIRKKIKNTTYLYEVTYYNDNGKEKRKWEIKGKLDSNGNVIPSKKRASAETVSLESLKASLNSPDSQNEPQNEPHSQNFNAANDAANDSDYSNYSNDTTVFENNNDNDNDNDNGTIITASTNATATPATATNKPIADTAATTVIAATTVADNSSDTTHNKTYNNTSDIVDMVDMVSVTSAMPDTKTVAKTTKSTSVVTDSGSFYDIPAEAPVETHVEASAEALIDAEASIDVVHDGAIDAQVSERTVPVTPEIVYDLDYVDYAGEVIELVHEQEAEKAEGTEESSQELSQRNLPQVISKKPTHFKMGTTKVENTLFDPIKNESIYEATGTNDVKINVSRRNSQKKRIDTLLYIDFNAAKENGLTISNEDRITPYDREIYNAVATLVAAGNEHISPNMIFQLLSGNTSDERNKMSEETREKIIKSVYKMRSTIIRINATAEVKACMMAEGIFEGYLIPATRVEIILNGQRVKDCIRIIDPLPLFSYASNKNQIASIDISLLDTPLNNTPENIELKAYLLRRILSILNAKNRMRDAIRYDTLYEYLRISAATKDSLKHKRKQIRDKVKILLELWKNTRLIKGYSEEKEGRIFAKVIIYC